MNISKLVITNFKGYADFEISFNERLNIIVGKNGSGKTALLEALVVAAGSFFIGIKNHSTRGIRKHEIHIKSNEYSEEYQLPVVIQAEGVVNGNNITWSRELNGLKNRTTTVHAIPMTSISKRMDASVREGQAVNLPLIAYYSTSRLFDEARKERSESTKGLASRFRAYNQSLNSKSTFKQFERWFKGKEISAIQKRGDDWSLTLIKETIKKSIPTCQQIYYEFDEDRITGLKVALDDGRVLPFESLSDGLRNYIALIGDLCYKCITLNPHHQQEVLAQTSGVVMIDELDLHLHPEWQKGIVSSLTNTFPKLQFFITTHSPFLIQETGDNELIMLDGKGHKVGGALNMSIEDIAEEIQDVPNPQWSKQREEMFSKARKYYKAKSEGSDTYEIRQELVDSMKPFARDTALYSILEQEKILKKYGK